MDLRTRIVHETFPNWTLSYCGSKKMILIHIDTQLRLFYGFGIGNVAIVRDTCVKPETEVLKRKCGAGSFMTLLSWLLIMSDANINSRSSYFRNRRFQKIERVPFHSDGCLHAEKTNHWEPVWLNQNRQWRIRPMQVKCYHYQIWNHTSRSIKWYRDSIDVESRIIIIETPSFKWKEFYRSSPEISHTIFLTVPNFLLLVSGLISFSL